MSQCDLSLTEHVLFYMKKREELCLERMNKKYKEKWKRDKQKWKNKSASLWVSFAVSDLIE